ncbi:MAG: DUF58 domain-containing protein [Verrucomicrobiae bacterium]|nr:DUF58 domain-containing protein [Verrucomicrobiae bacterium]NNJ42933.1 DUF58 domain-containing protein [Akkermansiaceae bacterium]
MSSPLSITRRCCAFAGGTVALFVGGILAADGLFMVLGLCGMLLVAASWIIGKWSLRNMHVEFHLPQCVSAGIPFEFELSLLNQRSFFDAFNTEVQITLPVKTIITAKAPWTPAGSGSRIVQQVSLPGRSHTDTHRVELSTSFPLGLFLSKRHIEIRKEVTVTPRPIVPREINQHGALHDTQSQSGVTLGRTFGEPRGIRPWQASDSARSIHWPASARAMARGHGLRIREYDPPGFHPDQCHIMFHSYATGRELLREDRFERALSLLAGSLVELQKLGIPCTLTSDFLNGESVSCGSRAQVVECLRSLAHVQRSSGTEVHEMEAILCAIPPADTLMVISDMPPDSWQHLFVSRPDALIIDIRQVRYRHKILHASR